MQMRVLLLILAGGVDLLPLKTTLSTVGKFGITGAFSIVFLYTPEIFPTSLRYRSNRLSVERYTFLSANFAWKCACWNLGVLVSAMNQSLHILHISSSCNLSASGRVAVCRTGVTALVVRQQSYSTSSPVSTEMGDPWRVYRLHMYM